MIKNHTIYDYRVVPGKDFLPDENKYTGRKRMRYKNLLDMHTHSDNSPDGNHSVTFMCESAEREGLRGIAITDHCECECYKQRRFDISVRNSYFESVKAQSIYSGRLIVMAGIELGQANQNPQAAKEVLGQYPFDFVLASLHNLNGWEDFYYLDYNKHDPVEIVDKYFDELYELAAHCDYDILSHLDYPLRYIVGNLKLDVPLDRYREKIDRVLQIVVARDKGLEINTSGYRQPLGRTMPSAEIIRRFKELGGVYLTIGSDAHRGTDVGAGISKGMQMAYQAGFRHTALYKKRVPILIPIE